MSDDNDSRLVICRLAQIISDMERRAIYWRKEATGLITLLGFKDHLLPLTHSSGALIDCLSDGSEDEFVLHLDGQTSGGFPLMSDAVRELRDRLAAKGLPTDPNMVDRMQLAALEHEMDLAVVERDVAIEEVKELRENLANAQRLIAEKDELIGLLRDNVKGRDEFNHQLKLDINAAIRKILAVCPSSDTINPLGETVSMMIESYQKLDRENRAAQAEIYEVCRPNPPRPTETMREALSLLITAYKAEKAHLSHLRALVRDMNDPRGIDDPRTEP